MARRPLGAGGTLSPLPCWRFLAGRGGGRRGRAEGPWPRHATAVRLPPLFPSLSHFRGAQLLCAAPHTHTHTHTHTALCLHTHTHKGLPVAVHTHARTLARPALFALPPRRRLHAGCCSARRELLCRHHSLGGACALSLRHARCREQGRAPSAASSKVGGRGVGRCPCSPPLSRPSFFCAPWEEH